MLTRSQCVYFCRDGFLLIEDALRGGALELVTAGVAELPRAHAHRNLLEHPVVRQFASSDDAMRFIRPVLGDGAFAVRGVMFDKLPEASGTATPAERVGNRATVS
ncbi:MAG: hypothetical protein ABIP94_09675 [Planctomycetota bacterium]